jgi:hypothetical protein
MPNNFLLLLNHLVSAKIKIEKSSHPTTQLVVSLIVNNVEHLIKAIADTGASSSSILKTYISVPFIKNDDIKTIIWITIGGNFNKYKTRSLF